MVYTHFGADIGLVITAVFLDIWIWVGFYHIRAIFSHCIVFTQTECINSAVVFTTTHGQIAKLIIGIVKQPCDIFGTHIPANISCKVVTGACVTHESRRCECKLIRKTGLFCFHINYPTQGITAIEGGTAAKIDFSAVKHKRIDGDNILQVTRAVGGIIHSNPIDNQQIPAGFEASDYRTTAAQLAFLHKHLTCLAEYFTHGGLLCQFHLA